MSIANSRFQCKFVNKNFGLGPSSVSPSLVDTAYSVASDHCVDEAPIMCEYPQMRHTVSWIFR